jgi:hypothetical protein
LASADDTAVVASGELCATPPTDEDAAACAASFFLRSTYALRLSFFLTGCGELCAADVAAAALGGASGDANGGALGVSGDCSNVGDVSAVADEGAASAGVGAVADVAVTGLVAALGVAGGGNDGVGVWIGDWSGGRLVKTGEGSGT